MNKSIMTRVHKELITEADEIMKLKNLPNRVEATRILAQYSRVARETKPKKGINYLGDLDFRI